MQKSLRNIAFGITLAAAACGASAQQLTEIKVSYQPALYWSLPFYVASQKGWWAELGLKPEYSIFPAGVPQIAASAAKSWDVGGTGSVPAVLGAARYNLLTIGLTNDESVGNALMASGAKAEGFVRNPASMKGQTIVLTANSTGDYAVQSCLAKYGLKKADVTIKSMGQAEIISAVSSNNADLAGLWAPNIYTLEEKAGAKVICSGKDAGAIVPGALIVRAEYAKEQPGNVAKFLAIYLRAWKWMNAHPGRGGRPDEGVLRAGRGHDLRGVDEEGILDPAGVRPRRTAQDHESRRRRVRGGRLDDEDRRLHEGGGHAARSSRGEQLRHRPVHEARRRRSQAQGIREPDELRARSHHVREGEQALD